jgi:hypothetical protein
MRLVIRVSWGNGKNVYVRVQADGKTTSPKLRVRVKVKVQVKDLRSESSGESLKSNVKRTINHVAET